MTHIFWWQLLFTKVSKWFKILLQLEPLKVAIVDRLFYQGKKLTPPNKVAIKCTTLLTCS